MFNHENNPITTLSTTYQNKLLTKIKAKFTETEQQLFVASFYGFLKYDSNNDFVIDLDDVWRWVGFSNKAHSKHLLEKQFVIDKDYKLLLTKPGKQSEHVRGGHNKSGHTTQRNLPFLRRLHLHLFFLSFQMFERFHRISIRIYLSNIYYQTDHEASAASVITSSVYSYLRSSYGDFIYIYYPFHFRCSRDFILSSYHGIMVLWY